LGERSSAQFQKKIGGALSVDLRALIVVLLDTRSRDSAGNAQRSLPVLAEDIHLRALFDEELNNRVDSFVGRAVKRTGDQS
jgi:hypothetical protein